MQSRERARRYISTCVYFRRPIPRYSATYQSIPEGFPPFFPWPCWRIHWNQSRLQSLPRLLFNTTQRRPKGRLSSRPFHICISNGSQWSICRGIRSKRQCRRYGNENQWGGGSVAEGNWEEDIVLKFAEKKGWNSCVAWQTHLSNPG